jgi:hypothetical protein
MRCPLLLLFIAGALTGLAATSSVSRAELEPEVSCPFTRLRTQRKCLNEKNAVRARNFLQQLPEPEQERVSGSLDKLRKQKNRVVELSQPKGRAPVFLLLQGVFLGEAYEWYRPLAKLLPSGAGVYFITLDGKRSADYKSRLVEEVIVELLRSYPDRRLEVIGFSAGGLPGLLAWQRLLRREDVNLSTAWLHTVASPIMGYPRIPKLATYLVRRFTNQQFLHDLMTGITWQLKDGPFARCTNHITTDCSHDVHACPLFGTSVSAQVSPEMPCGEGNVVEHRGVTHHEILEETIQGALAP